MRALVLAVVFSACQCGTPPLTTQEDCTNGVDDDRDGFIDCQDDACETNAACVTDCVDLCADGEKLCEGATLRTCALGVNGCRTFANPVTCDAGVCSGGACTPPPCKDQCGAGTTTCSGSTATVSCVKPTGKCSDWAMPMPCAAGTVCSSGRCVPPSQCTNQCTAGQTRCNASGGLERCVVLTSGCTDWGLPSGTCGTAGGSGTAGGGAAGGGVAGGGTAGGGAAGGGAAGGGTAGGGAAGGATAGGNNNPQGPLVFQKIPNITITDDVTRVAWHPSGRFALLLGMTSALYKYDATSRTLSLVQSLGTQRLVDLDAAADGTYFLVASTVGLWRVNVGAADALSPADAGLAVPGGTTLAAVAVEPGNDRFGVIGRASVANLNYLYTWQPDAGLSPPKGYSSSAGAMNLMWGAPALYAGSPNIVTSDGVNGASSSTWVLQTNQVVGNAWSAGFGNPGGAAWQPSGGYGVLTGWSSNKLYVFDGAWSLATLPGVGTAAAPQAVAFRADGNRALIVGRVIGPGTSATVIDYRPTGRAWEPSAMFDSSIGAFDQAPWFGNTSSMHLLDVAWRPGACDEGLIVGSDNGSTFSPTFGTVARFYDSNDSDCAP